MTDQPGSTRPSITAFFPCYNDAATIASIVITADRTLRELTDDYEIIVANDASTDNSAAILDELHEIYPHLRVMHHAVNHGYGGNLRSMFAQATKDLIFYTDGDGQYDPAELANLYRYLGPNVDVVQGWKVERHDPLHRIVIGRVVAARLEHGELAAAVDLEVCKWVLHRVDMAHLAGQIEDDRLAAHQALHREHIAHIDRSHREAGMILHRL